MLVHVVNDGLGRPAQHATRDVTRAGRPRRAVIVRPYTYDTHIDRVDGHERFVGLAVLSVKAEVGTPASTLLSVVTLTSAPLITWLGIPPTINRVFGNLIYVFSCEDGSCDCGFYLCIKLIVHLGVPCSITSLLYKTKRLTGFTIGSQKVK